MLIAEGSGIRVYTLDAGRIWLDGGAMFGVVPKPLWERCIPADGRNRIPIAMRCLLIEVEGVRVLVDDGLGNRESAKFMALHGVENGGNPTRLEDSLRRVGIEPEDVDLVVNTHLHFDHAGGNTFRDPDGEVRAAFPNARYIVRRGEWEVAHLDNARIRAGYHLDSFDPLMREDRLDLVTEDREIARGVRLVHTPGHTVDHQSVVVDLGGETVCYLADLVPTSAHVRPSWIMAYDLEPLRSLETKLELLTRAGRERWQLVFEHDPRVAVARASPGPGGRGCELEDVCEDEDVKMRGGS